MSLFEPNLEIKDIVFEIVSAYGTVGDSTGITPSISTASKILSMLVMFIGRLGPMTIVTLWYFSHGKWYAILRAIFLLVNFYKGEIMFNKSKNDNMTYGIVGLGRFGMALAIDLAESGSEIIALDSNEEKVQAIREYTENAFIVKISKRKLLLKQVFKIAM